MKIFTLPIFLGRGVRLFAEGRPASLDWALQTVRSHPMNVIEAHYRAA